MFRVEKRAVAALGRRRCSSDLAAAAPNTTRKVRYASGQKAVLPPTTARYSQPDTCPPPVHNPPFDSFGIFLSTLVESTHPEWGKGHSVCDPRPKMAVAVASLVIGAVVLVELAALAYLAFSIYSISAKIERVKEKIKGIPVKKNSRTKSNRTKSSRTKSRNNSKESKSKKKKMKNRKKGGRGDHFDEVADLGEVMPFPMPEATHPRIRVQRMADPESLVECADQLTSFIKSYKDKVASYPVSCGQSLYSSSTHSALFRCFTRFSGTPFA